MIQWGERRWKWTGSNIWEHYLLDRNLEFEQFFRPALSHRNTYLRNSEQPADFTFLNSARVKYLTDL
jgi:hypothetical protein